MSSYATHSYVSSYVSGQLTPYLQDAPSDGSQYARQNGAWTTVTGGGGGGASGIAVYDNGVTYSTGNQVVYSDRIFYMSTYVGGAGYDPINYPYYWTEISASSTYTPPSPAVQGVGSGYLIQAGDQDKVIYFTTTMGSETINLPADSTYAFPNGTEITICQNSGVSGNSIAGQYAGQPTINGAWNVTLTLPVQKLVKINTDTWLFA